ncbi:ORM1-like protein [Anopheles gambiae]|uniref:ORM1-like protein n=2 Tax=gambiae species complex TaxID=44542 RepID=A0A6E8W1Y0_ANOCL|nr:ORM1-like protein [Anopheles coluzzii]XP_049466133.1 ORM1-like protein [Anopheles coluzzii]XP_061515573.1 ORM1-like protein [Anopheles gambiae]XP_558099.4 ORM1-like protein [Anopheles gambiae]
MLAGGNGDPNPNASWLDSRGLWLAYVLGITIFHIVLLAIPFVQIPYAWTITNIAHNLAHLYFLHCIKGAPWMSIDAGENRKYTHWEQINSGEQLTTTRKFLTAAPIVLFLLTCLYTRNDIDHFIVNFISLVVVLVPKLPQFHGVRLFGINKY